MYDSLECMCVNFSVVGTGVMRVDCPSSLTVSIAAPKQTLTSVWAALGKRKRRGVSQHHITILLYSAV